MTNVMTPLPPPPPGAAPAAPPAPPPRRNPGVRMLWLIFGAVLAIGAVTFGAYNVIVLLAHGERTEVSSYSADGLTTIDVNNADGPVRITAVDGDEVVVRAEISDGLRRTGERQEVVGDELQLRATCPNYGSDWCRVGYEIQVPRDVAVVVRADSGSIDVTGTTGAVDVDADDGSVELTDLAGPVRASSDNGRVEGRGLRSTSVTADSDNGRVTLSFIEPPTTVTATSDNGSVEVIVPDDGTTYRVDIESDNGSTNEDLPIDPASTRSITAHSDNGSVTVRTGP